MKYWAQTQNAAGGWVDSMGTESKQHAIDFARYEAEGGKQARVVERTDIEVWRST